MLGTIVTTAMAISLSIVFLSLACFVTYGVYKLIKTM